MSRPQYTWAGRTLLPHTLISGQSYSSLGCSTSRSAVPRCWLQHISHDVIVSHLWRALQAAKHPAGRTTPEVCEKGAGVKSVKACGALAERWWACSCFTRVAGSLDPAGMQVPAQRPSLSAHPLLSPAERAEQGRLLLSAG